MCVLRSSVLLFTALALVGCGGGQALKVPDYDPPGFAQRVLEQLDADSDGVVSREEAVGIPGIAAAWDRYDLDSSGSVSGEELQTRAQQWVDRDVAIAIVGCKVKLDKSELVDVAVCLIPEEVHAGEVLPAKAVSKHGRNGYFCLDEEHRGNDQRYRRGNQLGLFRIELSHPSMQLQPAAGFEGIDLGRVDEIDAVVIQVEKVK